MSNTKTRRAAPTATTAKLGTVSAAPPARGSGSARSGYRKPAIKALLAAIWKQGPVSRSDLSAQFQIPPSSVTRVIKELMDAGLICEVSKGRSIGGRQPVLLAPNPDSGVVLGIDLSGIELKAALVTTAGELQSVTQEAFLGIGAELLHSQLVTLIRRYQTLSKKSRQRIRAIGISVPGTVNVAQGIITDASNLQVSQYAVVEQLQQSLRLNVPIYIEHDTIAAVIAERYYGAGQDCTDFAYVTVSSGIGAGLLIHDGVYRGHGSSAGELGHTMAERPGQPCSCGRHGCLETVASASALLAQLQRTKKSRAAQFSIIDVRERLDRGEIAVLEAVGQAADHLAVALTSFACLFDLPLAVIGGDITQLGDAYFDLLRRGVAHYQLDSNPIKVVPSQLGTNAGVQGHWPAGLPKFVGDSLVETGRWAVFSANGEDVPAERLYVLALTRSAGL